MKSQDLGGLSGGGWHNKAQTEEEKLESPEGYQWRPGRRA